MRRLRFPCSVPKRAARTEDTIVEIHIKELTPQMKFVIRQQLLTIKEVVDYARTHDVEEMDVDALEALCDKVESSTKYLSGFLDALAEVSADLQKDPVYIEGSNAVDAALDLAEEMIHG